MAGSVVWAGATTHTGAATDTSHPPNLPIWFEVLRPESAPLGGGGVVGQGVRTFGVVGQGVTRGCLFISMLVLLAWFPNRGS